MERRRRIIAITCAGLVSEGFVFKQQRKKKRRAWSKTWLLQRAKYGDMKLLKELKRNEPDDFKNYLRMSADVFDKLLKLVGPYIQKQNTQMRDSIPAEERLIVTLRFLATGRSYECLKFSSGISPQSLGRIIPETCRVIYEVLQKEYMKVSTIPCAKSPLFILTNTNKLKNSS